MILLSFVDKILFLLNIVKQDWLKPVSRADAKSTPSYSSDLHLSVLHYRPDRGALTCSVKQFPQSGGLLI